MKKIMKYNVTTTVHQVMVTNLKKNWKRKMKKRDSDSGIIQGISFL